MSFSHEPQHAAGGGSQTANLIGTMVPPKPSSDQYSLFRAYVDERHGDGSMAEMTVLDYAMMVEDSHVNTQHHRVSAGMRP